MAFVHDPAVLIGLAFASALAESPFYSASSAAIPNLVEKEEDIAWANSLLGLGRNAGIMLGPVIGGVLLERAGRLLVGVRDQRGDVRRVDPAHAVRQGRILARAHGRGARRAPGCRRRPAVHLERSAAPRDGDRVDRVPARGGDGDGRRRAARRALRRGVGRLRPADRVLGFGVGGGQPAGSQAQPADRAGLAGAGRRRDRRRRLGDRVRADVRGRAGRRCCSWASATASRSWPSRGS